MLHVSLWQVNCKGLSEGTFDHEDLCQNTGFLFKAYHQPALVFVTNGKACEKWNPDLKILLVDYVITSLSMASLNYVIVKK